MSSNAPAAFNRRALINWFLGTSMGALVLSNTNQVEAGQVNDPQLLDKGYKIVHFGADPVILVKAADNDFRAFSATCTHLDCIVGYQKEQTRIYCNCHGGTYDLQGRNVAGPPPRPLTPYKVNLVAKGSDPSLIVVSKA